MLIDGKKIAAEIEARLARDIRRLKAKPRLAVILVGDDPASAVYVRKKQEAAARVGVDFSLYVLPSSTNPSGLMKQVRKLANDPYVHGIVVQLPLPKQFNIDEILALIPPEKDVDALNNANPSGLIGATAGAVLEVLNRQKVKIAGSLTVVVGRGKVAGLPVAMALLANDATVTIAHSKTKNLVELTKQADILVSAVGKPAMITPAMVKKGAAVIDVGISRVEGKLRGDVDPAVEKKARFLTPVPGGIGPLTVVKLLENVFLAHKLQNTR